MKPIDRSKKSNIKCEYCDHLSKPNGNPYEDCSCKITGEKKFYWNRCKSFEWSRDKVYKEES